VTGIAEPAPTTEPAAMVSLATFPRARVLLIGTGRHVEGSGLPDVPAIDDTLADLRTALMTRCGLAEESVRVLADPTTAQAMGEALAEAADQAEGLLLVYYVGHGLVSSDGGLYLAACQTQGARADRRVSRVEVTGLPYSTVRSLVLDSSAAARVVVLDCCFSGKALAGLAHPGDEVANLAQVAGGYVLTSAGGEQVAFAPVGERHTAFTGALLQLLNDGDPDGPRWLSLQHAYRCLAARLPAAGFTRPRRRTDGGIGDLVLAANPAYRPHPSPGSVPVAPTVGEMDGVCPYKGLAAFDVTDQAWFRGRQALVARLVERLAERIDDPRPLLVTGASGSGKSSLLRAGLLPALSQGALGVAGSSGWPRLVLTPTADPVERLAACLTSLLPASAAEPSPGGDRSASRQQIMELIRRRPDQLTSLLRQDRAVLVVDQFEEVFTLCAEEQDRQAFIRALATLAGDRDAVPTALVVLGVRADFYGRCTTFPDLAAALEGGQVIVDAMTTAQIREAIVEPARAVGLTVQPGLVDVLLADLGADRDGADGPGEQTSGAYEPGRLPLLAHALRETWQQRTAATLTVEAYHRSGGLRGALAATADKALTEFDADGRETARQLLLRLVHLGAGTDDTRRRVPRADLLSDAGQPALAAAVLDAFAAARLLTSDDGAVQITHEALLRAWPTLRAWIDDDRAGLLVRQQLIDASHEWLRHDRDSSALYTGTRLTLARQWADPQRRATLPQSAAEFLTAGEVQDEQRRTRDLAEQAAARRRARRTRILAVVLALLLAGAVTGAGLAVLQWQRADSQQRRATDAQRAATARGLTFQAESLRAGDPVTAIRLGVAAMAVSTEPQTVASLKATLSGGRPAGTINIGHGNYAFTGPVAFNPRNPRVLATSGGGKPTGSDDDPAAVWDIGDRGKPRRLASLTVAYALAFSPDGRTLATADADAAKLWDVASLGKPRQMATLPSLGTRGVQTVGAGKAVVFSSRGLLAVASVDATFALWQVNARGEPHLTANITDLKSTVGAMAFRPDGRVLATVGSDDTAELWDVSSPGKPHRTTTFSAGGEKLSVVTFSPDGRMLATAGLDNSAELWDVTNLTKPHRVATLTGHGGTINDVVFSPDVRTLATASNDFTAALWDITDRSKPYRTATLADTGGRVTAAAFSPDGRTLATGSTPISTDGYIVAPTENRLVQLWDLSPMSDIGKDPVREACRVAGGGLTLEQWTRYVPGLPYTRTCPD
jgi:WD40 repeat protein